MCASRSRAKALLRHAVPSGDAAEIFDRAITLFVEALERARVAETSRPRARRPFRKTQVGRATFRRYGVTCGDATHGPWRNPASSVRLRQPGNRSTACGRPAERH